MSKPVVSLLNLLNVSQQNIYFTTLFDQTSRAQAILKAKWSLTYPLKVALNLLNSCKILPTSHHHPNWMKQNHCTSFTKKHHIYDSLVVGSIVVDIHTPSKSLSCLVAAPPNHLHGDVNRQDDTKYVDKSLSFLLFDFWWRKLVNGSIY